MEATVYLDVTSDGRIQMLATRRNPINDSTLEAFRIVRSGTRGTLLDLDGQSATITSRMLN
jgi:hypothetical protein